MCIDRSLGLRRRGIQTHPVTFGVANDPRDFAPSPRRSFGLDRRDDIAGWVQQPLIADDDDRAGNLRAAVGSDAVFDHHLSAVTPASHFPGRPDGLRRPVARRSVESHARAVGSEGVRCCEPARLFHRISAYAEKRISSAQIMAWLTKSKILTRIKGKIGHGSHRTRPIARTRD